MDTTQTKGAPATARPQTPRLNYNKIVIWLDELTPAEVIFWTVVTVLLIVGCFK